ncbi:MAG: HAMP domain-containing protein, partial [bacterium]|nr:HAMP domain-containing protein [bacterium]
GFILFLITGVVLFSIILKQVIKPVSAMGEVFERAAGGELAAKVHYSGDNEISRLGKSFNMLVDSFSGIIQKVRDAAGQVARGTAEISAGSDDLATRTSQEAASVTQTSSTLEELTAIVTDNRENSEETSAKLVEFNNDIQSRTHLMSDVTDTMTDIHESGKKIDDIVTVINEISFQTNLLALNAAVEAARAGEAGRGFAVVASEVRNLAQKTAESSKTIQEIVSQNVESTQRGMTLVNQTTQFFSTIVEVVQDILNRIELITDTSKEQAEGVEQINNAINQLAQVISQNAELVEELSGTSQSMKVNTAALLEMVEDFEKGGVEPIAVKETAVKENPVNPVAKASRKATASTATEIPMHEVKLEKVSKSEEDFFNSDEDVFEEF